MVYSILIIIFISSCISADSIESKMNTNDVLLDDSTIYDMQQEYARSGGFMGKAGSVYYVNLLRWIYFYDETSGTTGKLCAKPDCTHENGQCNAYISGIGGVQVYDGMLYFMGSMGTVERMDLSGNQRENVMTVRSLEGSDVKWTIHRGYVYTSIIKSTVKDGKPMDIYTISRCKLGKTGKEEVVFENIYAAGTINNIWRLKSDKLYLFMDEENRTKRTLYIFNLNDGTLETPISGSSEGYVSDFRVDGTGIDILEKTPDYICLIRYNDEDKKCKEIMRRTDTKGYVAMFSKDPSKMIFYAVTSGPDQDWIDYRGIDRDGTELFVDKLSGDTWYFDGYGSDAAGFLFERTVIEERTHTEELWRIADDTGQAELLIQHVQVL